MSNNVLDVLNEFLGGDLAKQASSESDFDAAQSGKNVPATEGERSAENSADVKASQPGETVDEAEDNKNDQENTGENAPVNKIGVKASPTCEDQPPVKDRLEDPGTSHPAKVGTEKFSSATPDELVSYGNDLLAELVVATKEASASATETETKEASDESCDDKNVKVESSDEKKDEGEPKETESTEESLDELREKAAAFDELVGYITGQHVAHEIEAGSDSEKSASDQDDDDELVKLAAAEAYRLHDRAGRQADDLVAFLVGHEKAAAGEIDPELLAELGAAEGGDMVYPEGGMEYPEGEAGDEEEIDPEVLEALIEALAEAEHEGGGENNEDAANAAAVAEEASEPQEDVSGGLDVTKLASAIIDEIKKRQES